MIQSIVAAAFDTEIELLFSEKPEIRKYILEHERKKLCIENLTREIKYMEIRAAIKLDHKRIANLTRDFARTFAKASLEYHGRQNENKAATLARAKKDAYSADIESDIIQF